MLKSYFSELLFKSLKEIAYVSMDTKSDDDQVKAPVGKHVEMSRNSSRKVCWEKRDAYFACLDKNGS